MISESEENGIESPGRVQGDVSQFLENQADIQRYGAADDNESSHSHSDSHQAESAPFLSQNEDHEASIFSNNPEESGIRTSADTASFDVQSIVNELRTLGSVQSPCSDEFTMVEHSEPSAATTGNGNQAPIAVSPCIHSPRSNVFSDDKDDSSTVSIAPETNEVANSVGSPNRVFGDVVMVDQNAGFEEVDLSADSSAPEIAAPPVVSYVPMVPVVVEDEVAVASSQSPAGSDAVNGNEIIDNESASGGGGPASPARSENSEIIAATALMSDTVTPELMVESEAAVPTPPQAPVAAADHLFGGPPASTVQSKVVQVNRSSSASAADLFGSAPASSSQASAPSAATSAKVVHSRLKTSGSAADLFGSDSGSGGAGISDPFGVPSEQPSPSKPPSNISRHDMLFSSSHGGASGELFGGNAPAVAEGDAADLFSSSSTSSFALAPPGPPPSSLNGSTHPNGSTSSGNSPRMPPIATDAAALFSSPASSNNESKSNSGSIVGSPANQAEELFGSSSSPSKQELHQQPHQQKTSPTAASAGLSADNVFGTSPSLTTNLPASLALADPSNPLNNPAGGEAVRGTSNGYEFIDPDSQSHPTTPSFPVAQRQPQQQQRAGGISSTTPPPLTVPNNTPAGSTTTSPSPHSKPSTTPTQMGGGGNVFSDGVASFSKSSSSTNLPPGVAGSVGPITGFPAPVSAAPATAPRKFQGKATLVSGASPFDTPSTGPPSVPDSLFGNSAAPAVPAAAVVNSVKGGRAVFSPNEVNSGGSAASLFDTSPSPLSSNPPLPNKKGGATTTAPTDAANIFATVSHSNVKPTAATTTVGGKPRKIEPPATASDLFSRPGPGIAPAVAPVPVVPGAPPSAPGVRVPVAPPASTSSVMSPPIGTVGGVGASSAGGAGTPTTQKPPASSTGVKMTNPPPGMIATPHGFVKAPSKAPTTAPSATNAAVSEAMFAEPPPGTAATAAAGGGVGGIFTAAPPVDPATLNIHHHPGTPQPVVLTDPSEAIKPGVGGQAGSQAKHAFYHAPGRGPACPVASFGFGGKLMVMIPQTRHILNPLLMTPDEKARPLLCGQLYIHRMIDLISSQCSASLAAQISSPNTEASSSSSNSNKTGRAEIRQLVSLLTSFSGPLLHGAGSTSVAPVKSFLAARSDVSGAMLTTPSVPLGYFAALKESVTTGSGKSALKKKKSSDFLPSGGGGSDPSTVPRGSSAPLPSPFKKAGGSASNAATSGKQQAQQQQDEGSISPDKVVAGEAAAVALRTKHVDSEKLLWKLLEALIDTNGAVSSSTTSGQDTPEQKIVRLLIGQQNLLLSMQQQGSSAGAGGGSGPATLTLPSDAGDIYSPDLLSSSTTPAGGSALKHPMNAKDLHVAIEALLLSGKRDEAAQLCVDQQQWGLAFMLASVCSPAKYQSISKAFAEKHFATASPLHLLSLVYSNQAQAHIAHGGRQLSSATIASTSIPRSSTHSTVWRRNLAALISNKSGDWVSLIRVFANRLLQEEVDTFASHFAYICAGSLPSPPSSADNSGYTLLGCDMQLGNEGAASLNDVMSVSAFRMTEVFEWCISRGLENNNRAKAAVAGNAGAGGSTSNTTSGGGVGSFITGLFRSSSNNELNNTNALAEASASSTSSSVLADNNNYISNHDFILLQACLCPFKLQFAQTLADYGLMNEALAYAKEIRRLMNTLEIKAPVVAASSKPPVGKSGKASTPTPTQQTELDNNVPRLFRKSHAVALDLLMDRLEGGASRQQGGNNNNAALSAPLQTASTSTNPTTGGWGLTSLVSAITNTNLKELEEFISPTTSDVPPVAPAAALGINASAVGNPPTPSPFMLSPTSTAPASMFAGPAPTAPVAVPAVAPVPSHVRPTSTKQQPPMSMAGGVPRPGGIQAPPPSSQAAVPAPNDGGSTAGGAPSSTAPATATGNTKVKSRTSSMPYPGAANPPPPSNNVPSNNPYGYGDQGNNANPSAAGYIAAPTSVMPGSFPAPHGQQQASGVGHSYSAPPPSTAGINIMQFPQPQQATQQQQQHQYQQQGFSNAYSAPPQPSSSSSKSPDHATTSATDNSPDPRNRAVSTSSASPNPKGGLVGSIRKGWMKLWNPNATEVSTDNMGTENSAYYDEKLKKWIFPGEDPSADNDIAAGPPPTGPMPSAAPPATNPNATNPNSDAYDPLAALMAPPPRTTSYGAPASSYGMGSMGGGPPGAFPPMSSNVGPPGAGGSGGSAGGPPGSSAPPPSGYNAFSAFGGQQQQPPQQQQQAPPSMAMNMNMWKPPPSTSAGAAGASSNLSAFMGVDLSQSFSSTVTPPVQQDGGNVGGGQQLAPDNAAGTAVQSQQPSMPPQQQFYSASYVAPQQQNENELSDVML